MMALALLRHGYSLLDYPWLVRLNPAAPWKTRGNAAVAILVEAGSEAEARRASTIVLEVAKSYMSLSPAEKSSLYAIYVENADDLPDYFRTRPRCLEEVYWRALHELYPVKLASSCLNQLPARGFKVLTKLGEGRRGVVGVAGALGYTPLGDYTFELLVYRKPENWLKKRNIDPETVRGNPSFILAPFIQEKIRVVLEYGFLSSRATPGNYFLVHILTLA
jgi:tRNA(Ile2)-agmatinylcytidine synthase